MAQSMSPKLLRSAALALPPIRRLYDFAAQNAAERDVLAGRLAEAEQELARSRDALAVAALTEAEARQREAEVRAARDRFDDPRPDWAPGELLGAISSGADLDTAYVRDLAAAVERQARRTDIPSGEKLRIHQEIGRALFARSQDLYCGKSLPAWLLRYTYPPFVSILLNTHCNAACFFCREADYKGTSIEFSEIPKLDGAIRQARVIDLTGWGEPFLCADYERIVDHVLRLNDSPQLIQVTTNGSLLSKRWGRTLSGKLHLMVISLNAATPETYAAQMRYKNSQFTFDKILKNLREFTPELTDADRERLDIHMVANTDNYREMTQLVRVAADLGVPQISIGHYISANKAYMDKTLWHVKESYNEELAKAQELADSYGIRFNGRKFFVQETKKTGAETCMAPFESFFIEAWGTASPCCFMGNERHGNVFKEGFEAVWFSEVMNRLRDERSLPPCKVCTIFTPFDEQESHISAVLLTENA